VTRRPVCWRRLARIAGMDGIWPPGKTYWWIAPGRELWECLARRTAAETAGTGHSGQAG